jgi:hypothetical protein
MQSINGWVDYKVCYVMYVCVWAPSCVRNSSDCDQIRYVGSEPQMRGSCAVKSDINFGFMPPSWILSGNWDYNIDLAMQYKIRHVNSAQHPKFKMVVGECISCFYCTSPFLLVNCSYLCRLMNKLHYYCLPRSINEWMIVCSEEIVGCWCE